MIHEVVMMPTSAVLQLLSTQHDREGQDFREVLLLLWRFVTELTDPIGRLNLQA